MIIRLLPLLAITLIATTAVSPADRVRAAIRLIQSGKAQRGAVFTFTSSELNAYARSELPTVVPQGVRELRLELRNGAATGYALIDFLKLQRSGSAATPWLIGRMIEGERPVKVDAQIESGGGRATVHLLRVEISGLAISGYPLDFLIQNFFTPLFPNAKINQPFELNARVDRIEVSPTAARVIMRR